MKHSCWETFVWLLLWMFVVAAAEVCDKEKEFQCEEDGKCIPLQDRCNGTPNCKYGSDESFAECKVHPRQMESPAFHCAYGASMIEEVACNNISECPDGSDELPQVCEHEPSGHKFEEMDALVQGQCASALEIECLPGECVPMDRKCDGSIDCSNGRDESVELCMQVCGNCFKCANGVSLDSEFLCDSKLDCLDGSDELPNVCKGNSKGWIERESAICVEPPDGSHRFTSNTKFYSRNGTLFVYPNQPAELRCQSNNRTAWNVCRNDGTWNRELPPCRSRPVNRNPDTNGTNGCRMDWYNPDTMNIYQLLGVNKSIITTAPIQDIQVRFVCIDGNTFLPYKYTRSPMICDYDGTWKWQVDDFNPRCVKLCRPEELAEVNNLIPKCYDPEQRKVLNCDDKYSMLPGTVAVFDCAEGFTHMDDKVHPVVCSENGIWEGLKEICSKQENLCKYKCNRENSTQFSKGGRPTNSLDASWVVPIYAKRNSLQYEFACVGNLIALNVVLTAAHCVTDREPGDLRVGSTGNRSQIITENYYAVRHAEKYSSYFKGHNNHDLGIIILEKRVKIRQDQQVVCLPDDPPYRINLNSIYSKVLSWSDDGYLKSVTGTITEPRYYTGDVAVNLISNEKLCPGDSGSGLIVSCPSNTYCLVGVISRSSGAGERGTNCSAAGTAARIDNAFIQNWIQSILVTSSRCPLISL